MPNQLDPQSQPLFPVSLDSLSSFLQMLHWPLGHSKIGSGGIDALTQTIPVDNIEMFDEGPSIVSIPSTNEIIWYETRSGSFGNGSLLNCKRNWGNNVMRWPIMALNDTNETFDIPGDWTATGGNDEVFEAGVLFTVSGSNGNDGEFEVSSAAVIGSGPSTKTRITVTGDVVPETYNDYPIQIASASDFTITESDSSSNYFKVAGDQTGYFYTGAKFRVKSSTGDDGIYTVTSSAFGTETQINVANVPVGDDTGSIHGQFFDVSGNHVDDFPVGANFEINGSTGNDGAYVVADVQLSAADTRIEVSSVADTTDDGTITVGANGSTGRIFWGTLGIGYAAPEGEDIYQLMGAEPLRLLGEAILELEAKVGIALSTDPASHEFRITQLEGVLSGTVSSFGILGVPVSGSVVDGDVVYFDGSQFEQADIQAGHVPVGTVEEVTTDYAVTDAQVGGSGWFEVAGDHRGEFPPGGTFSIAGSTGDDGAYTVVSSALNGSGDTRITVATVPTGDGTGTITVTAWKLVIGGIDGGHSSLTPGDPYYAVPGSPGDISTTPSGVLIGIGYTSTSLVVSIRKYGEYPRILLGQAVHASVTERDVVYYDQAAGELKQAVDTYAGTAHPPLGIAINVGSGVADIVIEGQVSGFTGLTAGARYFLKGATAGKISATRYVYTSHSYMIGVAESSTVLRVQIMFSPHAVDVPLFSLLFNQLNGASHVQGFAQIVDDFLNTLTHAQVSSTDPSTDVTGAELERLTDGSDAGALHNHDAENATLLGAIDYDYVSDNDAATDVTGAELESLTDGSDIGETLHSHDEDYGYGSVREWRRHELLPNMMDGALSTNYYVNGGSPTVLEAGSVSIVDLDEGRFLEITDNSGMSSGAYIHPQIKNHPQYQDSETYFRVKSGSDVSSIRWWCGFFLSSSLLLVDSTPSDFYAAFRYATDEDGTAFWRCVSDAGSGTPTVTITGVAIAVSTVYRLSIRSSGSNWKFYINDTLVATHAKGAFSGSTRCWLNASITSLVAGDRTFNLSTMFLRLP